MLEAVKKYNLRLFNVLAWFPLTASETELDYYH